ncbi:MAG TPA: ATP-binding protein [Phycisphaerae bacterium]|nr:ATP-binding protein [Phycisphaerae bacterium]
MRIAVASGKGGTGKTTVATNLAMTASRRGKRVVYLDCDVEEPNGALFLKPEIERTEPVSVSVPAVDKSKCTGCGLCGKICQYSAILPMKNDVLLFLELCHGCAGCWLVCPTGAIRESSRTTGQLQIGRVGGLTCVQGLLNIGEAMSPPVIRAVKASAPEAELIVLDSPPGTSCPVIESVRDADFVLLVTEPTPFGLNDLRLAVEVIRALGLPFAVAVNRAGMGDDRTQQYCEREGIEILVEIPDDRRVAEAYSRGEMACDALPEQRLLYDNLLQQIESRAAARVQ